MLIIGFLPFRFRRSRNPAGRCCEVPRGASAEALGRALVAGSVRCRTMSRVPARPLRSPTQRTTSVRDETKPVSWVTIMMVVDFFKYPSVSKSRASLSLSMFAVGSSRMRSSGSAASARATSTRRRCPPERAEYGRSARSLTPLCSRARSIARQSSG